MHWLHLEANDTSITILPRLYRPDDYGLSGHLFPLTRWSVVWGIFFFHSACSLKLAIKPDHPWRIQLLLFCMCSELPKYSSCIKSAFKQHWFLFSIIRNFSIVFAVFFFLCLISRALSVALFSRRSFHLPLHTVTSELLSQYQHQQSHRELSIPDCYEAIQWTSRCTTDSLLWCSVVPVLIQHTQDTIYQAPLWKWRYPSFN